MSEQLTSNECIAIKTSQGRARSTELCPRCGSGPCHRTSKQEAAQDYRLGFEACSKQLEALRAEFERYRRCLYRANGRLIQLSQEPEKLDYEAKP